jgi:hypothetical protein
MRTAIIATAFASSLCTAALLYHGERILGLAAAAAVPPAPASRAASAEISLHPARLAPAEESAATSKGARLVPTDKSVRLVAAARLGLGVASDAGGRGSGCRGLSLGQ